MTSEFPRRAARHGRKRQGASAQRNSRSARLAAAFAGGAAARDLAAAGPAPNLHVSAPESPGAAWVSGGLSALVHAAAAVALFLGAWLAPDAVDEIIPVKILKDAPPSDAEPAPAPIVPRALAPRRPAQVASTVAPRTLPRAAVAQPTAVAPIVPTETVQMARIDPARAPAQVVQQQVVSDVVQAVRPPSANSASPIAIAPTSPVAIAPSSVSVLEPAHSGPVAVAPTQRVEVGAPQAFSSLGQANASEYAPSADVPSQAIAGSQPTGEFGVTADFAFDTVDRQAGGAGTGGSGSSEGTARCLESTYTQRYYEQEITPRVLARWKDDVVADEEPGGKVVLRFVLDASGTATAIEVKSATSEALGASCVRAMRDASPFPPLGGDLRCLAGRNLQATFKVPD